MVFVINKVTRQIIEQLSAEGMCVVRLVVKLGGVEVVLVTTPCP